MGTWSAARRFSNTVPTMAKKGQRAPVRDTFPARRAWLLAQADLLTQERSLARRRSLQAAWIRTAGYLADIGNPSIGAWDLITRNSKSPSKLFMMPGGRSALSKARKLGLDLVLVSSNRSPACSWDSTNDIKKPARAGPFWCLLRISPDLHFEFCRISSTTSPDLDCERNEVVNISLTSKRIKVPSRQLESDLHEPCQVPVDPGQRP